MSFSIYSGGNPDPGVIGSMVPEQFSPFYWESLSFPEQAFAVELPQ